MHLKSNAQAKGGVLSYRNLEVCTCARDSVASVEAVAGNPMKLRILEGLPRRLHATPSRSLFSEDVEPPIAARRGGGGAATRRGRIPLLTRCFALVEQGVAAVAVQATSAEKCGMLHEHSQQDWSAQRGQNYRVSIAHFERQWSCRVAWLGCWLVGAQSVFV